MFYFTNNFYFSKSVDCKVHATPTLKNIAFYLYRYERAAADYIEKLPAGKHSVKGVGKTEPDPAEYSEVDGARVPFGKGVKKDTNSDLLYNEYIVYDVAQVSIRCNSDDGLRLWGILFYNKIFPANDIKYLVIYFFSIWYISDQREVFV